MIDVTTWVAHAYREPSDDILSRMDRRWIESLADNRDSDCAWLGSPLHALAMAHVDRAAHKRRLRTIYVGARHCEHLDGNHGFSPTSELIPHDMYGPELVSVQHTEGSPLAAAIRAAKSDPNLLTCAVFTEAQFVDVDAYDDHSGKMLRPEGHGVVIPVLYVADDESADDAFEREDLLRANGFASYTIDAGRMGDSPLDLHRNFATLIEDVFDEVAHLKADAAARILSRDPLWPLIVVRGPETWDPTRRDLVAEGTSAA